MAFEHKELSGSMFEQNDKTKDTQPDLKGKIKIQGKLWDIAAWRSDRNPEMFSIKISEPRAQQQGQQQGGYQGEHRDNPRQQSTQQALRESRPRSSQSGSAGAGSSTDDIPFAPNVC